MNAIRLPNGYLLVPARAESKDGSVLGDGMNEVGPDDLNYDEWLSHLSEDAVACRTENGAVLERLDVSTGRSLTA